VRGVSITSALGQHHAGNHRCARGAIEQYQPVRRYCEGAPRATDPLITYHSSLVTDFSRSWFGQTDIYGDESWQVPMGLGYPSSNALKAVQRES
jgi:hypothetical protein